MAPHNKATCGGREPSKKQRTHIRTVDNSIMYNGSLYSVLWSFRKNETLTLYCCLLYTRKTVQLAVIGQYTACTVCWCTNTIGPLVHVCHSLFGSAIRLSGALLATCAGITWLSDTAQCSAKLTVSMYLVWNSGVELRKARPGWDSTTSYSRGKRGGV